MAEKLKLVLPKGRLQEKVSALLGRIGIHYTISNRSYRPVCSDANVEIKLIKPQNIPSLIGLNRHDCGFTGLDWVQEAELAGGQRVVELLDLGFDKVRIVAAVPEDLLRENPNLTGRQLVVATEYPELTKRYVANKNLDAVLIKTYGATEALPPEDADMIVDNTSTGSTLRMNRLEIVDDLLASTTRFICSQAAHQDREKQERLAQMTMLMKSALDADQRVMLEMNVPADNMEALISGLPSMRSPTVAPLYGDTGFAVKVAVPIKEVPQLIPRLIALGAKDILEYRLEKIVL